MDGLQKRSLSVERWSNDGYGVFFGLYQAWPALMAGEEAVLALAMQIPIRKQKKKLTGKSCNWCCKNRLIVMKLT